MIIHAEFPIQAQERERFLSYTERWVKASLKEAGVISYRAYEAIDHPNTFSFVEVYTDQAALDAHHKTAHVKEMLSVFPDFLAGQPDVQTFDAQNRPDPLEGNS